MDTDHQVIKHSNSELTFTEKLRHSKALILTMAVMGVTVMAIGCSSGCQQLRGSTRRY